MMGGNLGLVLLGLAGLVMVAAGLVRGRRPDWHWYLVGYVACWARMRLTWKALTVQCELTGDRRGSRVLIGGMSVSGQTMRPIIPALRVGRPLPDGLLARVRLLPGQTPDEYAKHAAGMMHAWRVHSVRVSSSQRGFADIRVLITDTLSGIVERDPDAPPGWDSQDTSPTSDMPLAAVVGVREDSKPWVVDLRAEPHVMVTGATQTGKSTLLHALVTALAPFPVALVGVDLKGGLELSMYTPRLSGLATTRREAADLLARVLGLAEERMHACRRAGVQSIWKLVDIPPPIVLIVDEIAELYRPADSSEKATRELAVSSLLSLAQRGAVLGIHLVVCGQRVGSDLGAGLTALRAQLGGRICHHVHDSETAVMTLGDMWPEAVQAALMLTAADQGIAVTSDGAGGWVRARGALTTAEQAAAAAQQYAVMTPQLAGIARPTREGGDDQ